jgi:hypothetical protein
MKTIITPWFHYDRVGDNYRSENKGLLLCREQLGRWLTLGGSKNTRPPRIRFHLTAVPAGTKHSLKFSPRTQKFNSERRSIWLTASCDLWINNRLPGESFTVEAEIG